MTNPTAPAQQQPRVARRITDGLEPKNWIIAVMVLLGWHVDGVSGVGWGLVGALFAAVIPTLFITYGMRRGRWADRNVGVKRHRLIVMTFILASVATGILLLAVCDAPHEILVLVVGMLGSLAALAVVTIWWKISVHAAVAAAGATIVAFTYGPIGILGYALVALVGWSRIVLRDHTTAQVLSGTALGCVAAVLTYAGLR